MVYEFPEVLCELEIFLRDTYTDGLVKFGGFDEVMDEIFE